MENGMETKVCNKCGKTKSISSFYKRTNRPCGVQSKCKTCQNSGRIKYYKPHEVMRRKFNISESYYIELMKQEDCPCCGKKMEKKCIDHNHKTEKIRGVICNNCNTALGLLDDNKETLSNLIQYLERSEQLH